MGKESVNSFKIFADPVPNYKEQAFFHDIEEDIDGNSNIALVNSSFDNGKGIGIWAKFNKNNLQWLSQ